MTGGELKKFRLDLHLTQTEFGLKLGYAQPQIRLSEMENGHRPVPYRVELICKRISEKMAEEQNGTIPSKEKTSSL